MDTSRDCRRVFLRIARRAVALLAAAVLAITLAPLTPARAAEPSSTATSPTTTTYTTTAASPTTTTSTTTATPTPTLTANPDPSTPAEETVIRVGYFPFSGYHNKSADGELSGYGYDLLQKLGAYIDATYEYLDTDGSYSESLEMLQNGELDIVTSVSKTPEREEIFLFSDESIGTNSTIFTVKTGNNIVVPGEYDTYDGLTIGMIDGNSKNKIFDQFSKDNGFTYNPVYFETEAELTNALQNGDIDGAVSGSLRTMNNEWVVESISPDPFYIVTNKNNPELMAQINAALEQLDLNEPDWRNSLTVKYYSVDEGGEVSLTPEERAYIDDLQKSGKKLSVMFNPDRYPYSYFEDGVAAGIMPDLFSEIAVKLNLPYEYVDVQTSNEYYELRATDEVSIIIDFLTDYYQAEQLGYKITEPYLDTGFTRLTLSSNEDNGVGDVIALPEGATTYINFVEERYPDKEIRYYATIEDMVNAVRNGEVDSTIIYYYTAEDIIHRDVRNQLTFSTLNNANFEYSFGVSNREPSVLLTLLSKGINSIGDTGISQIVNSNTGTQGHHLALSFGDYLYTNPLLGIGLVALLLLLLFVIAMLVIRSRNQRRLQTTIDNVTEKYEQQKKDLSDALFMSRQANRAKTTFLNSMSHDIRTPMNAIIGFSKLASEHIGDQAKVEDYLDKISTSSDHLLALINDVLDMSRIESGKVNIENAPEDLRKIIEAIAVIVGADAEARKLTLTIDDSELTHPLVYCDRLHLNQVLINVLSNAIKFTPESGSVTFSVSEGPGGEPDERAYTFVVSDTGIGIKEEFLKTIFDPFTRERTSTVTGTQGTGLGMAITKNIVDMMGGYISIASVVDEGTTVTITLNFKLQEEGTASAVVGELLGGAEGAATGGDPVAGAEGAGEDSAAADERGDAEVSFDQCFPGRRVLLVEDNLFNQELAQDILADADFETVTVGDGTEAVEAVREHEPGYFDVVLMDIQMPVMDGYTAAREIRALGDERAEVPIIALTADAFEEDRLKALAAGMNGHLTKPIDVDALFQLLRTTLTHPA